MPKRSSHISPRYTAGPVKYYQKKSPYFLQGKHQIGGHRWIKTAGGAQGNKEARAVKMIESESKHYPALCGLTAGQRLKRGVE